MKFTRKTDYALRTMQFLARSRDKGPIAVHSIAEQSHLSLKFLQGIVSKLSKAGLVSCLTGPKGGIALSKDADRISILDIIEAVEGKINLMDCMEHPSHCHEFQNCSIINILYTAQAALVNQLGNSTLKLMVSAKSDPFNQVPERHFLKPQFGCPVLK